MKFFEPFWKPSFYKNKEKRYSFWGALGRLVFVNFLIGIVSAGVFYATFGKDIPSTLVSFKEKLQEGYPAELILSVKDGMLSKNIKGDLKLYPLSLFTGSEKWIATSTVQYLVDIDDSKEASLASFTASNAVVFMGKDGVVIKDEDNIRVYSYKSYEEVKKEATFSKDTLTSLINTASSYIVFIPWIISIAIIVFYTIFASIGNLIILLFVGLIIMFFSVRVLTHKAMYGESYILSLYALSPIIILKQALSYIPYVSTVVSKVPFVTTLMIVVFLWYMFKEKSVKEQVSIS